jgi:hydroxymethylglutaryl-CoA lyase
VAGLPPSVKVKEVAPRDGLQSEPEFLPTDDKLRLVNALVGAGLKEIEATAFVSPKAIPALADAAEVFAGLERRPGVVYSANVSNEKGARRAVEAGADEVQVFLAASEGYNRANVRMSVEESLAQAERVAGVVLGAGVPFVAVVSTAFGCPYDGDVPFERVLGVSGRLISLGAAEITLGDTIGMGYPTQVRALAEAYRERFGETPLRMHFHDTRGMGLANVLAALEAGVDRFDASVGGIGGSPYAEGATGNVATEDLVHMLHEMGVATGVDLDALVGCAGLAEAMLGHELPGKVSKVGACGHLTGEKAEVPV